MKFSKETKKKMSLSKLGKNNPMWGNKPWNKGLTKNEHPILKKISESREGKGNPMYKIKPWNKDRKPYSKESLGKMSKMAKKRKGGKNSNWKGGRIYDGKGYILIYSPHHPFHNNHNYVFEHRLVMEKYIKRFLLPTEIVHHINGIIDDNKIENLQLFSSNGLHFKNHKKKI